MAFSEVFGEFSLILNTGKPRLALAAILLVRLRRANSKKVKKEICPYRYTPFIREFHI